MGLFDFLDTSPTQSFTTTVESNWEPQAPPDLSRHDDIELDVETDGLDWRNGPKIGGIGVCYDGKTQYLPFKHQGGKNLDEAVVKRWAQTELKGKRITNHSIKFDLHHLSAWDVDLEEQGNEVADIAFDFALLDDHRYPNKMGQADLCKDFLSNEVKATIVQGIELNPERMMDYPSDIVAVRCEADVRQVHLLKKVSAPRILKEGLDKVRKVENDCIFPVCEMERNGMPMDVEKLHRWHKEVTFKNGQTLLDLSSMVGFACSPDSAKDMVRVFEKYDLPIPEKNGKPTFTDEVLSGVDHPVIQIIRKYGKSISLLAKLTEYKNAVGADGILRYALHQLLCEEGGTITGRFSSSNVNIQQVMKTKKQRAAFGDEYLIRELFLPGSGLFLSSDGRQIEYRIFAHYANSPRINAAFAADPLTNFHQLIFGMLSPHAPKLIYEDVKNINFMRIYGGGIVKLALMMGYITKKEADELQQERDDWRKAGNKGLPKQPKLDGIMKIDAIYNRELPEVRPLLKKTQELAETRGFVRTMLGRRGRFPGQHKRWAYKAFNTVGQGGGADILKIKIIDLHRMRKHTQFKMRAAIHDQVVGDIPDTHHAERVGIILDHQSFKTNIPILWETKTGHTWKECD